MTASPRCVILLCSTTALLLCLAALVDCHAVTCGGGRAQLQGLAMKGNDHKNPTDIS